MPTPTVASDSSISVRHVLRTLRVVVALACGAGAGFVLVTIAAAAAMLLTWGDCCSPYFPLWVTDLLIALAATASLLLAALTAWAILPVKVPQWLKVAAPLTIVLTVLVSAVTLIHNNSGSL